MLITGDQKGNMGIKIGFFFFLIIILGIFLIKEEPSEIASSYEQLTALVKINCQVIHGIHP